MRTFEGSPQSAEYEKFIPDFANDAAEHGIFESDDVRYLYQSVVESHFSNEIDYQQGLLPLLWACRSHYLDEHTKDRHDALHGTAFCLADIHYKNGYYSYCLDELRFVEQRLDPSEDAPLMQYIQNVIKLVSKRTDNIDVGPSPVRTEILVNF